MIMEEKTTNAAQSPAGLVARLVWLLAGPMALAVTAGHIAVNESGAYGWGDGLYFGILAASILARLLDVAKLGGTTADGGPATMGHFVRYAALLAVCSAGLWAVAHWLGASLA